MQNKTDENMMDERNKMDEIKWANEIIKMYERDGRTDGRTDFNCRLTRSRPTKTNNIEQYLLQYYKQTKSLNSTPNGVEQYFQQ